MGTPTIALRGKEAAESLHRPTRLQALSACVWFGSVQADPPEALEKAEVIFAFDFGTGTVNPLLAAPLVRYWIANPGRTVVTQPNIERAARELFAPDTPAMGGQLHLVLGPQDVKRERQHPGGAVRYHVVEHVLPPPAGKEERYIDTHDVVDAVQEAVPARREEAGNDIRAVVQAVRNEVPGSGRPAIVIAQRDHLWRAAATVAHTGFHPLIPPDLPDGYDPEDGQWQVRGRLRFRAREVGARLYYLWKDWI